MVTKPFPAAPVCRRVRACEVRPGSRHIRSSLVVSRLLRTLIETSTRQQTRSANGLRPRVTVVLWRLNLSEDPKGRILSGHRL